MSVLTFESLKLNPAVLKSLAEMGFENPTEIQAHAIPVLTKSRQDFIGQAQTGTGKTAAFVIPLLEKVTAKKDFVQAIVLAPTRELAKQVENEIYKIGKYLDIKSTCIYGGSSYERQIRILKKEKPQIVVGTPGRVIDLIKKEILDISKARYCVLDEADEMLNMGFLEDVKLVVDLLPKKRQLIMFSATMPRPILSLIDKSFQNYEMVKIEKKSLSNEDIEQKYFIVKDKYFREALARLIDATPDIYGLVFCRTKIETRDVGDHLKARGYAVEVLNGDMGQAERDHAMRKFKERKVDLLVCTDVAARGIDVNNLTHVFNYGLPQDNESYVHRIGRTGRAGMKGIAYTIVGPKQAFIMRKIEKHINKKVDLARLPSIKVLKAKVVEKEMENATKVYEAIQNKGNDFNTDDSYEIFRENFKDIPSEDLLKLMFTWKFNKTLRHYNNLEDIEQLPKENPERGSGVSRRRRGRSKSEENSNSRNPRSRRGRPNSKQRRRLRQRQS